MLRDGGVRADVAHENRDDHPLGRTDLTPVPTELLGQTSGQEPRQRLTLLLAIHNRLVEQPQSLERPLGAGGDSFRELDEHCLHFGVDRFGRESLGGGDGLDGLALGHHPEKFLFGG